LSFTPLSAQIELFIGITVSEQNDIAIPVQRHGETHWIFRNRLHRLERKRKKHSWIVKKNLTL
jgi:hypothetical protein